jgi:putative PIN family toxin of toxin-antitoxin system
LTERHLKTVLDTNVLISGLFWPESTPARAMNAAFQAGEVLVSSAVVGEFEEVLRRPKFNRQHDLEMRLIYLRSLLDLLTPVTVVDLVDDCRDPRDNMFLELALGGRADVIVTGDDDLLCLHPWRGIAILSPADYLARAD